MRIMTVMPAMTIGLLTVVKAEAEDKSDLGKAGIMDDKTSSCSQEKESRGVKSKTER